MIVVNKRVERLRVLEYAFGAIVSLQPLVRRSLPILLCIVALLRGQGDALDLVSGLACPVFLLIHPDLAGMNLIRI